jgi:hypothetical protein
MDEKKAFIDALSPSTGPPPERQKGDAKTA